MTERIWLFSRQPWKLIDNLDYNAGTFTLTSYTGTDSWTVYAVNRAEGKGAVDVTGVLNVYDDQEWLVRELIESYRVTCNSKYLEKAEYLTLTVHPPFSINAIFMNFT